MPLRLEVMAAAAGVALGAMIASHAASATRLTIIAAQGQTPPQAGGAAILFVSNPFTNARGQVGFTGNLTDGNSYVWYDRGIRWLNSDAKPSVLVGAEPSMGIGNWGQFVYSPVVDGLDALWNQSGMVISEDEPAPGIPGYYLASCIRPTMLPNATVHWISAITPTPGGIGDGRAFYTRAASGDITLMLQTGQAIEDLVIRSPIGITNEYDVSNDNAHHIHVLQTTTGIDIVCLNGAIVLRRGDLTSHAPGEHWETFDIVAVNTAGDWLLSGDTDKPIAADEFIAFNGQIVMQEGDTVDGVFLPEHSQLRGADLNNLGRAAHIWNAGGAVEHLWVGDAATLGTSSIRLLSTGDEVDLNGDDLPDAVITDFRASTANPPGLSFSDHDWLYFEVELQGLGGGTPYEAIVRIELPAPPKPCPADCAEPAGSVDVSDLLAMLAGWGNSGPCDVDAGGTIDVTDLLALLAAWGPCP